MSAMIHKGADMMGIFQKGYAKPDRVNMQATPERQNPVPDANEHMPHYLVTKASRCYLMSSHL